MKQTFAHILAVISFFCVSMTAIAADPYTVVGVAVDANGETAIEAQTKAMIEGQTRAAEILIDRVTLARERHKLPSLEPELVQPLVRAQQVLNEKRSAKRYFGNLSVAFNPVRVKALLETYDVKMIATQARERLVLPVMDGQGLWVGHSWNYAMRNPAFTHSLTPLRTIAPGEGSDAIIGNYSALNADLDTLRAVGERFDVAQILIAHARQNTAGVRVTLTDVALDTGQTRELRAVTAPTFQQAAYATVEALESDWKRASVSLAENAEYMVVSVLYRSLNDWQFLQDVINGSAQIQDARLDALSKDGALMTVSYGGDMNRLRNELAFKGVDIREHPQLGVVLSRTGFF